MKQGMDSISPYGDVADLLPHRQPFIMIDRLTHYDGKRAQTALTVRADNPFCVDGMMEEAGLIENIAQTCAARTGYKEKADPSSDGTVKIGYIGMIKTMEIARRVSVGERLTTDVEIMDEAFNAMLVGATVRAGEGETVAVCEMKLFLTDRIPE